MSTDIRIKRIYDPPSRSDGYRVLIDRLWPRGVKKESAALDEWLKSVAPSPALRIWFGHDPQRWKEFSKRYGAELQKLKPVLKALCDRAGRKRLTLVYGAKDPQHTHALVLQEALRKVSSRAAPVARGKQKSVRGRPASHRH